MRRVVPLAPPPETPVVPAAPPVPPADEPGLFAALPPQPKVATEMIEIPTASSNFARA